MKTIKIIIFFLIALTASLNIHSQNQDSIYLSTGPENGSLVVVGGGFIPDNIFDKFIELAGGVDAHLVVIPTASEEPDLTAEQEFWEGRGFINVSILHTRNKEIANSDDFVLPLKNAQAVWFGGGRQWRLVDSYKDTKTEELLWKVLKRGGVIGGSSAGATIQGSYLARGDTKNNQIMMGDHEEGFGFMKNTAIDQHLLARNRQFDMFDILKNKPELLGMGIDESTAIIVNKNTLEVMGNSYVIIYDGTFWSREGSDLKNLPEKDNIFYFLREGDRYDLKKRKIIVK